MCADSVADTCFLSVGLDIGTTTTHLVISQLTIGAGEDPFGRHHLLDKQIVHRSAIYLTPMLDGTHIDASAIHRIVSGEYAAAGVRAAEILTGAVIVTGETALKENAEAVVQRLAGESSSFAAAVAGANAESILAGRGSGAAEHSRRHHCCVVNVDIGGGTTNLAWFVNGEVVAAGALRVGGRHLLMAEDPGSVEYRVVTETAARYLGTRTASFESMRHWVSHCGKMCTFAAKGLVPPMYRDAFVITWPDEPPPTADAIFFTGGVGEVMSCISRGEDVDVDAYGDTGPRLARLLCEEVARQQLPVVYPAEPIRATVIGAGQFSMTFSGETLWADARLLPLRNLPVLRLPQRLEEVPDAASIAAIIEHGRQLHSIEPDQVVAVALPGLRQADWNAVVHFAGELASAAVQVKLPSPWVFTMRDNFGRLLGKTMAEAYPAQALIVVDEIDTGEADFIDIGKPVEQRRVVIPIAAKTLLFER